MLHEQSYFVVVAVAMILLAGNFFYDSTEDYYSKQTNVYFELSAIFLYFSAVLHALAAFNITGGFVDPLTFRLIVVIIDILTFLSVIIIFAVTRIKKLRKIKNEIHR